MGQKVNPVGIRLGIVKDWESRWYTKKDSDYAKNLLADIKVRKFLEEKLIDAGVARIDIERLAKSVRITICVARP
ncbi:30S ribosomal protein S3, partial [Acinetobacter baumannii]